jgi:hypothetical protein
MSQHTLKAGLITLTILTIAAIWTAINKDEQVDSTVPAPAKRETASFAAGSPIAPQPSAGAPIPTLPALNQAPNISQRVLRAPLNKSLLPHNPVDNGSSRFPAAVVIDIQQSPTARLNVVKRIKLLRTDLKYPLVRVVETVQLNPIL